MGMHGLNDVRFDFDGSLALARRLWQLADLTDSTARARETAAGTAAKDWRGELVGQFDRRSTAELSALRQSADQLRAGARGWGRAWKEAMDENNRRRRARKVTEIRDSRSALERFGDIFVGDDSDEQVPAARTVAVPGPPNFAPTDTPQVF